MKKILSVLAACILAVAGFGCADKGSGGSAAKLKIFAPDGAPAFALSGLMTGEDTYDFEIVPAGTIGQKITTGAADLLIIPTNAIVNLYNKGKDYRIIAEATRGNLFVVGKSDDETLSLNSLLGKTVGVIGQGQTPDLVFRFILKQHNIEIADEATPGKIALRYFADGPAVIQNIVAAKIDFGVLGEPAATNATKKVTGAKTMDVQALYRDAAVGNSYGFPQAVLAVNNAVYTARKAEVDAFVDAFVAAKTYAVENPSEAVERVKANVTEGTEASIQSLTAEVAGRCNIANAKITAAAKADIAAYIGMILDLESGADVSSVGGKLPDESIYILA